MAEFVEFRAEEWIPELEQMERIHLFDPSEIKSIASKRREFEYKIQRRTKNKEDFLKYIQFEVDLLRIVKGRREKTGINTKKSEIEYSQASRIARLFKHAIFRFQSDIKLWMSFFKFCKDVKFHSLVSQMLVKMLQIHSSKPNLWVFASKWEFEDCNSVDNARQFLTKGLRYHPSSDILYTELFKLELEHLKKKRKEKEERIRNNEWMYDEVTDNIIRGRVATVIYEAAVKSLMDASFKVNLLNVAKNYEGTINIQKRILYDLVTIHSMDELTWDTIAKREFEGITCDLSYYVDEDLHIQMESEKKSLKERIQKSVDVYEESVRKLNTVKMWSFYLDHVIAINNDKTPLPVYKFKLLRNAMEGALASGNLDEIHYLRWIEILRKTGKDKKVGEVLKKGTEQYPSSLELWHARLRLYMSQDDESAAAEVFSEAIQKMPDAIPLWKLAIQYFQMKSLPKAEEIFRNGILRGGEIGRMLKPLYIEWLVLTKGILEARKVFDSPEMQHPPCLELYNKMASLECIQVEFCPGSVRKCHELACQYFGQNNINVWLEYAKFELKQGDVTNIDLIYRRAVKSLEPQQADEFITGFNFFKTTGVST